MALPVGHGLVGLAIAKKTKVNPILAFILANLPDIDYFFGLFFAGGNMLALHRTDLTHSPLFAVFVAILFYLWGKIRGAPYKTRQIIGIFLIVLSHWVVDYTMPFVYTFDFNAGKNGFFDFLFAHIISIEFIYNNLIDVGFFGTLYVLVVKFVFREKKLF